MPQIYCAHTNRQKSPKVQKVENLIYGKSYTICWSINFHHILEVQKLYYFEKRLLQSKCKRFQCK